MEQLSKYSVVRFKFSFQLVENPLIMVCFENSCSTFLGRKNIGYYEYILVLIPV